MAFLPAHSMKSCSTGLLSPGVSVHIWRPDSRSLENAWCIFLFRSVHWTSVCGHPGWIPWRLPTKQWNLLCKCSLTPNNKPHIFIYPLLCPNTEYEYEKRKTHQAISSSKAINTLNLVQGRERVPVNSSASSLLIKLVLFSVILMNYKIIE